MTGCIPRGPPARGIRGKQKPVTRRERVFAGARRTRLRTNALPKYLDSTNGTALLLRRFDRIERAQAWPSRSGAFLRGVRPIHAPVVHGACAERCRGTEGRDARCRRDAVHVVRATSRRIFQAGSPLHRRPARRAVCGGGRRQLGMGSCNTGLGLSCAKGIETLPAAAPAGHHAAGARHRGCSFSVDFA
jgi:hypothetical protein